MTRWVTARKGGDAAAAQPLWERYHRRLVALVRQKLGSARSREAIADGALTDVSETAKEAGFRYPVALTAAAWARFVAVPLGVACQDQAGRRASDSRRLEAVSKLPRPVKTQGKPEVGLPIWQF